MKIFNIDFSNMKISGRIFAGFSCVIFLLAIVAITGAGSINKMGDGFSRYRTLALQTNESGRVQANMLMTRINVLGYLRQDNQKAIDNVKERSSATFELADGLLQKLTHDDDKILVNVVKENLQEYSKAFNEVTNLQNKRNDIVENQLDKVGPQIERNLSAIMKSAMQDGDAEAAYNAGQTLRQLLLARIYVTKYLLNNSEAAHDRVNKEINSYKNSIKTLQASLQNPKRRALASESVKMGETYHAAFENVYNTINERNHHINNELNRIGPIVAKKIEDLKLEVKAEQDELGPQMMALVTKSTTITIIISLAALVAGLLIAKIIGGGISKPIGLITKAMEVLSTGDTSVEVPAKERKDEVGQMAQALEVFKQNRIEADRLDAEQKKAQEAQNRRAKVLDELTQGFDKDVSELIDTLSSATTELDATAQSMASIAEETTSQSTSMSSVSESTSSNIQNVASAAEELTASIGELSTQVSSSSKSTKDAVTDVEKASQQIAGLERAAERIGEVVDLIQEIAEQTNLLALNATIEAARAGDAGKGFAVVASEVKNLASQTGKATEEISQQIDSIQSETRNAVIAVNSISEKIAVVNEASNSIAVAIEEQNASTAEISRNTQVSAEHMNNLNDNVKNVSEASQNTGAAAEQVLSASRQLSQQTTSLEGKVKEFLTNVKEA